MADKLLSFYRGEAPDSEGRTFEEILAWRDEEWEACHDYIQWLFPTRRPSNYNEDAPILEDTDVVIWKADPVLQENLQRAYYRWLDFLGLEEGEDYVAFKASLTEFQINLWSEFNHNFLRITRVLDCLVTLGQTNLADDFYAFLKTRQEAGDITDNTFRYWTQAFEGKIV